MKQTIQVRLDPDDIKKLEEQAEQTGHTISSLARFIILEYLKNQEA